MARLRNRRPRQLHSQSGLSERFSDKPRPRTGAPHPSWGYLYQRPQALGLMICCWATNFSPFCRSRDWGRSGDATPRPSHQTGHADFPHPAFQSALCSLMETGQFPRLGRFQAEEPKGVKVSLSPAVMVVASSAPSASTPLAQDGAQPSPSYQRPFAFRLLIES